MTDTRQDLAAAADALRSTFPGCDDAPLALTLLRVVAEGEPVSATALAARS